MGKNQRIYLLGMMGSGKSHWCSKLGRRFGWPHYDLDKIIEQEEGMSIAEIFEHRGEAYFRELESRMLKKGIAAPSFILATGGGTPCYFDNMDFMKSDGLTIWLKPSIEELIRRIKKTPGTRPIVAACQTDEELYELLAQLMDKRIAWYAQADIIVEQDVSDADQLEEKIVAKMQRNG